jgi:RNA polymerase sigma-70 factor (ECF subfamily)
MPNEREPDLLRRFVNGDHEAFEQLFRQSERDVYRWVLRIVRDTSVAEDLVIEAFWRAYRSRARFDPSRTFGAWMRRIATNAAKDHLRTARRGQGQSTDDVPAPAADQDTARAVALAMNRLPPRLRIVATLALIEGTPYGEIADALALPLGTVKSRVFRAVRALREELTRLGIQP